jgi:hypothetical protein
MDENEIVTPEVVEEVETPVEADNTTVESPSEVTEAVEE